MNTSKRKINVSFNYLAVCDKDWPQQVREISVLANDKIRYFIEREMCSNLGIDGKNNFNISCG